MACTTVDTTSAKGCQKDLPFSMIDHKIVNIMNAPSHTYKMNKVPRSVPTAPWVTKFPSAPGW